MQSFLETLASLVAYIVGLVLIVKTTPRLLFRSYDEVWFMVFAVVDILGAFLLFGGIVVSLAAWNANIGIKALDFLLLVLVMLITGYMALSSFRNNMRDVQLISRYAAGIFCLFLLLAALCYIVLLFR
jgi:uncharacterized membrane protein YiaA